jgi:5-methyltetrahydropteroyltriglutamate--homocysteine methyltransferase
LLPDASSCTRTECGIDIGNNGEQPRESFFTYVQHRMSGFGGRGERPHFKDIWSYPSFMALNGAMRSAMSSGKSVDLLHAPQALSAVAYRDRGPLERECGDYIRLAGEQPPGFVESFIPRRRRGLLPQRCSISTTRRSRIT